MRLERHAAARGRNRVALALLAAVPAMTATSVPALAAVPGADDGRWYYEATGMADIHQTTTGQGITVAVLDGRVNTGVADLAGADVQPHEPSYCAAEPGGEAYPATTTDPDAQHATSIATMLVGTDAGLAGQPGIPGLAPGITLRTYAVYVEGQPCETPVGQEDLADDAVRDALTDGADIILVPGTQQMSAEVVAEAQRAGAIVVGSAGNDGTVVTGFPATLNGVVATGTITSDMTLDDGSVYGPRLGVVAPGAHIRALSPTWDSYGTTTGSSNAAAYTAGALALLWSLHPDATDGQVLQALVRTTDGEVKDTWAQDPNWGYGIVNARVLLTVDPTAFPDENPFVSDEPDLLPTIEQILGTTDGGEAGATSDPAGAATEEPTATPEQDDPASGSALPLILGAGGVVVVGAIAITVLLRRRRTSDDAGQHDAPQTYARGNHG
ncbi:S8 family serine peptidase [Cellulomonas sp. IC4_254]|uniref:S8 family serine peptidase n=1 Tax=Cellulomonas sp. IC4_254 TaxID=2714040 RepID=UPI0014207D50|nr:S8 family serine peptidase [Cellulomonas sp. IC4_254]NHT17519.1 S8 family serine peptidase [Cellulomonas sp. IC4_254]